MLRAKRILAVGVLLMASLWQARADEIAAPPQAVREVSRLERARYLYSRGIVFEAIINLEAHVADRPEDVEALYFLARLQEEVGHEERAAVALTQVLRLEPGHQDAERLLTRIRNNLGRQLNRRDPAAVLRYARLCARPGSYDRAAAFYRLALSLEESTGVHLEFARMLSWAGDYEESAYHYGIVLERNPGSLSVQREAGRVFSALGDFERAVTVFENYLDREPEDASVQRDLILVLIWSGRLVEAESRLRALLRRDAGNLEVLLVRGALAEAQDRLPAAYDYYRDILEQDPEHTEAIARIAALERGDRLAMARLRQRVDANPDDVEARLQLARLYERNERYGDAIEQLEQINRRFPENEEVFVALRELREKDIELVRTRLNAVRAARATRQAQEVEQWEAWLDRNPGDHRTRFLLARQLIEAGRFPDAERELTRLQEAVPEDPLVVEMMRLLREQRAQGVLRGRMPNGRGRDDS